MLMDQIPKLSKIMSVGYLITFGMSRGALLNHAPANELLFYFSRIGVDGMKMQVCTITSDCSYGFN